MNYVDAQSQDAWSAFWRTGSGASCFDDCGMDLNLHQIWSELVDKLSPDARVLDLATGNGAVAMLCAKRARERDIRLVIDAVDAARIDPPSHISDPEHLFRQVRLQGGIKLEKLPFDDERFLGIVSQFGFEYADEKPAMQEAARVLAPGGHLRLIIHAKRGVVSRDIRHRVARLHSVLEENGPVSLVLALAKAAESGDMETLKRITPHLRKAKKLVKKLAENPPNDDSALFYSTEFLQLWSQRQRYRPIDLRVSLEDGWKNVVGMTQRQQQMLLAARSCEDIGRISDHFAKAGLVLGAIRPVCQSNGNTPIAWQLDMSKPEGS